VAAEVRDAGATPMCYKAASGFRIVVEGKEVFRRVAFGDSPKAGLVKDAILAARVSTHSPIEERTMPCTKATTDVQAEKPKEQ
jgi:hypothetical protein